MKSNLIIRGEARLANHSGAIGGKAANLARALEAGHAVPDFYVITADAFNGIMDTGLPTELIQAIAAMHHDLFPAQHPTPVAVRSSAIAEDGQRYSFAGMHDSELGVVGVDQVIDAVKRVWASAFSERAIAYRAKRRLPAECAPMAVMVQRMVAAQWSGVLFTRDPLDASSDHVVINAAPGSGEPLVQGRVSANTFHIDRRTLAITVLSPAVDDPPASQLREAAAAGLALEEAFGSPQDVEFCFDAAGQLAILQTRPITAGADHRPQPETARTIWDNSNIIESYPGVTSPMTFSFIRRAYAIVYRCFSEVMGIPPRVVRENQDAFDNMLGLFHGRVYYNLTNWHRLIQLFPGYRYNRDFMESMMGVKQAVRLADRPIRSGFWRRWLIDFPALVGLVRRSAWNFLRIRSLVARFDREFDRRYAEWSCIDFAALAPDELLPLYAKMEAEMFARWKTPIINDFFVMVLYGTLRKLCAAWCGDATGALQNGLLTGDGDVASAEPVAQLLELVGLAHDQPALKQLILAGPVQDLHGHIGNDARFTEFNRCLNAYLHEYGLRCVEELKLESPTYRDCPHLLFALIQSYLAMDAASWQEFRRRRQRERQLRSQNEQQALKLMADAGHGKLRQRLFRWILANTRLGVRNRENMRLARTKIFDVFRSMLRSIGATFEREGILDCADDIFYLTSDEMWGYVKGAAVTTDLRSLVALRRRQYVAYRDPTFTSPPRRFETCGLPYLTSELGNHPRADGEAVASPLTGHGGCPGVVTGVVELVRDPRQARFDGDILVAEQTDPGWTALYPAYAGILVERGSVLSHSMIVAREFGVPAIVGVDGLTRRLHDGDRVRMDGHTGTVEVLSSRAAPESGRPPQSLPSAAVSST